VTKLFACTSRLDTQQRRNSEIGTGHTVVINNSSSCKQVAPCSNKTGLQTRSSEATCRLVEATASQRVRPPRTDATRLDHSSDTAGQCDCNI